LDEATAALDPKTEEHVLAIIADLFKDRTTLTIAHRLDTIISSDTVMVMEKGELKEMESPSALLEDRGSMFSSLVDKLGPAMAAALRHQAREHALANVGSESGSSDMI
jgi:ABC-type multidrug transport system fused ATPase/permease subunit